MKTHLKRSVLAAVMAWSLAVLPAISIAQTTITAPKNKYPVSKDVEIGNQAAREAERQFPVINDQIVESYIQSVGDRLVAAIPRQFQHPEFNYRFQVVDASDLNAFALPGGPMYVNRGMIQAARNEGELAGVMAHELSHVALRHATAQATKQGSVGNQLGMLGMILGGAVLGGQAGAQAGMLGAQAWMTKYSREYESQADTLGAQIMATAGYDPHDLANVFQTIARQGGSRGPEWLSSHPDPGNRYDKINREAGFLKVSGTPIKLTREFERVKARLSGMRPSRSMEDLQRDYERNGGGNNRTQSQSQSPTSGGRYTRNVERPSTRTREYSNAGLSIRVPDNWREFSTSDQVTFAPEGGYGDQGITHGVMIGLVQANGRNGQSATQDYVDTLLQSNNYLRQRGSIMNTTLSGRSGNIVQLAGRSEITGETELVTLYTTLLPNGILVYIAAVSPQSDSPQYENTFRAMINSLRLNG